MLDQFRSKAHLYSDLLRSGLGTVDVLSIMQHHGAPTRLLDWTYSPSMSLPFSLRRIGWLTLRRPDLYGPLISLRCGIGQIMSTKRTSCTASRLDPTSTTR